MASLTPGFPDRAPSSLFSHPPVYMALRVEPGMRIEMPPGWTLIEYCSLDRWSSWLAERSICPSFENLHLLNASKLSLSLWKGSLPCVVPYGLPSPFFGSVEATSSVDLSDSSLTGDDRSDEGSNVSEEIEPDSIAARSFAFLEAIPDDDSTS